MANNNSYQMVTNNYQQSLRQKHELDSKFKQQIFSSGLTSVAIPFLTGTTALITAYVNYNNLKTAWDNYFNK